VLHDTLGRDHVEQRHFEDLEALRFGREAVPGQRVHDQLGEGGIGGLLR
jgi:hypothetical protein